MLPWVGLWGVAHSLGFDMPFALKPTIDILNQVFFSNAAQVIGVAIENPGITGLALLAVLAFYEIFIVRIFTWIADALDTSYQPKTYFISLVGFVIKEIINSLFENPAEIIGFFPTLSPFAEAGWT